MALSFDWLINPVATDTFFKGYFEQKPLRVARNDPTRFSKLLTIDDLDRYLASTSPNSEDVFLVDASRAITANDYAHPDTGKIDVARALQLYATGATISLSQLQTKIPSLAALCRAVEKVFSSHFQTNIYLTPPNAQGFKIHYDSHDVFVLQITGSKHWTLYDTQIELPLHGQGFNPDLHKAGAATEEFTLHAGDVLYCPRGLFHAARSTDEVSLHITLGLMGKTWADAMIEAVSDVCLANPAFRKTLPIGFANGNFDNAEAVATFRELVQTFARDAKLEVVLNRLAENFVTSRTPDFVGSLSELSDPSSLSGKSRVQARPDVLYRIQGEGDKLHVLFGSTTITLPSFTREPLEFALCGQAFAVDDLPGDIDEPGKLVLIKRLIKEGLVTRLPGKTTAPARKPALQSASLR